MSYQIMPVKMGNSGVPFDMSNFYKGHPIGTEGFHMPYAYFIIKNVENGECYLVDTGCSLTEENVKEGRRIWIIYLRRWRALPAMCSGMPITGIFMASRNITLPLSHRIRPVGLHREN